MTGELRDAARAEHAVNSGAGPARITRAAPKQAREEIERLSDALRSAEDERDRLAAKRHADAAALAADIERARALAASARRFRPGRRARYAAAVARLAAYELVARRQA